MTLFIFTLNPDSNSYKHIYGVGFTPPKDSTI